MKLIIAMILNTLGMFILGCILDTTHIFSTEWYLVIFAAVIFNIAGVVIHKK